MWRNAIPFPYGNSKPIPLPLRKLGEMDLSGKKEILFFYVLNICLLILDV
jgi:hypothetical protein